MMNRTHAPAILAALSLTQVALGQCGGIETAFDSGYISNCPNTFDYNGDPAFPENEDVPVSDIWSQLNDGYQNVFELLFDENEDEWMSTQDDATYSETTLEIIDGVIDFTNNVENSLTGPGCSEYQYFNFYTGNCESSYGVYPSSSYDMYFRATGESPTGVSGSQPWVHPLYMQANADFKADISDAFRGWWMFKNSGVVTNPVADLLFQAQLDIVQQDFLDAIEDADILLGN